MTGVTPWRGAIAAAALTFVLGWGAAGEAQAQVSREAYRVGLKLAQSRHYANPDCYARVFSRHARRTNHVDKRNYWAARAGPAFKGELWSECGISR
ncbi:hypothetical protein [Bosea sp. (in: a-proteobacteria)]|uniref:hypothetical protein n=1 Tax=Bosea sp. (in: a-proteobacteria) TaxID=1871050 RepID=UPI002FC7FE72